MHTRPFIEVDSFGLLEAVFKLSTSLVLPSQLDGILSVSDPQQGLFVPSFLVSL
jgi:hypothetical protein